MEKLVMTDGKRRRGLMTASALLGGVLVLSACGDGGDKDASAGSSKTSQAQVDEAAARTPPRRR
ncbi:hypothetical protein NKH18_32360 [Streptomyces sp. M10(2022)]